MSRENVEIARVAIQAWNAGDMARLEELYDPGAVMRNPSDWVDAGPYLGRDAVMEQFRQVRDIWRHSTFEEPRFLDAGDRVVVQVGFTGDTRGLPLTTDMAWVYTIRNRRIISLEFFRSREEALQTLELTE